VDGQHNTVWTKGNNINLDNDLIIDNTGWGNSAFWLSSYHLAKHSLHLIKGGGLAKGSLPGHRWC